MQHTINIHTVAQATIYSSAASNQLHCEPQPQHSEMFIVTQLKEGKNRWRDKTDIHKICYQSFRNTRWFLLNLASFSLLWKCSLTYKKLHLKLDNRKIKTLQLKKTNLINTSTT